MAVRMVALKRTQRGLWTARKVIPTDVREAYGKREEKRTWPATLGLSEAKSAYASWLAVIEARIENLRKQASGEMVTLTHRETLALAGSWYAAAVARHENAPGDRLGWQVSLDDLEPEDTPATYRAYERGASDPDEPVRWRRQPFLVADVDELLLSRGLVVDAASREALIEQVHEAHRDLCRLMLRRCDGVVMLRGWMSSSGSVAEHNEALRLKIPIFNGEKSPVERQYGNSPWGFEVDSRQEIDDFRDWLALLEDHP